VIPQSGGPLKGFTYVGHQGSCSFERYEHQLLLARQSWVHGHLHAYNHLHIYFCFVFVFSYYYLHFYPFKDVKRREKRDSTILKPKKHFKAATLPHRTGFVSI